MTTQARTDLIQGIRDFADWLAAHPDVPAPRSIGAQFTVLLADEAERLAEVERVAALIGVAPVRTDRYVEAEKMFGPVRFTVYGETNNATNRWLAEQSYSGAVQPADRSAEVEQAEAASPVGDRAEAKIWACPEQGCGYHIADGPVPDGEMPTHDLIAEHLEEHSQAAQLTAEAASTLSDPAFWLLAGDRAVEVAQPARCTAPVAVRTPDNAKVVGTIVCDGPMIPGTDRCRWSDRHACAAVLAEAAAFVAQPAVGV